MVPNGGYALSIVIMAICQGGALSSDNASVMHGGVASANASAAVAEIIGALSVPSPEPKNDNVVPIPEHHQYDRSQRIVPRKGVINDITRIGTAPHYETNGSAQHTATAVSAVPKPEVRAATAQHSSPTAAAANPTNVTKGEPPLGNSASGHSITNSSAGALPTSAPGTVAPPVKLSPATSAPPVHPAVPPAVTASASNRTVTAPPSPVTTIKTSTISTTSTTALPRTTTTAAPSKPPKKPKIVFSVEDEPKLLHVAKTSYFVSPYDPVDSEDRHRVDEPLAQLSQEYIPQQGGSGLPNEHREYILPIVTLIFVIPLLLGLFLLSYRRAKEFWLTRHYRRMDFLIDGMYNY